MRGAVRCLDYSICQAYGTIAHTMWFHESRELIPETWQSKEESNDGAIFDEERYARWIHIERCKENEQQRASLADEDNKKRRVLCDSGILRLFRNYEQD